MSGRLQAPAVSHHCLDLAALAACDDVSRLPALIRSQREQADHLLVERFWDGAAVAELLRARAWVVERLVLAAWRGYVGEGSALSLIALGGFGRGELHPHSDVDLLVLTADSPADGLGDDTADALSAWVQCLWDAGLTLGHSVRSLSQCEADARQDVQFATNLMEARLLQGDQPSFASLRRRTSADSMWPADAFFAAKYAEQESRHASFNDTAYRLEPNIKEGPGGLRDIQMVEWVARRHFHTRTLYGLVEHDFLTEAEYAELHAGQLELWRLRFALHCLADRGEDRLLFDYQRDIAGRFGFADQQDESAGPDNSAVERFMQQHYRTVMQLERLNEQLLQLFREELLARGGATPEPLDGWFQARDGYLEVRQEDLFLRDPGALLRLFLVLATNPKVRAVRAATQRLVRHSLYLIDDNFRADADNNQRFLQILRQPRGVYSALQRMNRYGVLAAFLPVFGRIVGRMQFDLFHAYTVDQHILFVIRNLRRFALDEEQDRFPHAHQVFQRIEYPELLYLAALFHDIAKGREGDHSDLGAADATAFGQRLGLPDEQSGLVAWLVQDHLLMSQVAQRRDITDPEVVQQFAMRVGDQQRLDYLYLLTMADIAATSPKLWNTWKDSLLWDLYVNASQALQRGLENPLDHPLRLREARAEAFARLVAAGMDPRPIEAFWRRLTDNSFLRLTADQLEWITQALLPQMQAPAVAIRRMPDRGASELLVYARDYTGLFAALTAVLDHMRLNILSARVMTTRDGHALDLFQLLDSHDQPLASSDVAALSGRLLQALDPDAEPASLNFPMPRRLRQFIHPPRLQFSDHPGSGYTLLELECGDRPGLLSVIARCLANAGVQVHDARIATFGDRVEDTFLVSDAEGRALGEVQREGLGQRLMTALGGMGSMGT